MFHHDTKPIRHAIDLLPTHIRRHQKFKSHVSNLKGSVRRSCGYFGGHGIYSLLAHRNQRGIVKISYTQNTKTRLWTAHGEYLQREHAQVAGEKGLGFNQESNSVDIKTTLRQWQRENDLHMFKLIISPENGHKLDLKKHARDLMQYAQYKKSVRCHFVIFQL